MHMRIVKSLFMLFPRAAPLHQQRMLLQTCFNLYKLHHQPHLLVSRGLPAASFCKSPGCSSNRSMSTNSRSDADAASARGG